ncbi:hypothetical protein RB195_013923 [Necator americanus]
MSRLVILFLLTVAECQTKRNTTDTFPSSFCTEYAECMGRANQKSAECLSENTTAVAASKKKACEGALELHMQLQALYDEKNEYVENCVRENAAEALTLSTRKTERCKTALRKAKRSSPFDPAERRQKRKERKERKEKPKSCSKEAKRMRWQCSKIAKCCSVVKNCNAEGKQRDEINEKKNELKKLYAACHGPELKKKLNHKHENENDDDTNKQKKNDKAEKKQQKEEKKQQKEEKKQQKEEKKSSKSNEKLDESKAKRAIPMKSKALAELSETEV